MSLYERTISFVLNYIEEKKLEEGAKLPTEPELVAMAGVSMVTVRRALAELAAQGVIRREQGRGTFLNRSRVSAERPVSAGCATGSAWIPAHPSRPGCWAWSGATRRPRNRAGLPSPRPLRSGKYPASAC
jgi:DNA-binding transcriptional MocR family regulator